MGWGVEKASRIRPWLLPGAGRFSETTHHQANLEFRFLNTGNQFDFFLETMGGPERSLFSAYQPAAYLNPNLTLLLK